MSIPIHIQSSLSISLLMLIVVAFSSSTISEIDAQGVEQNIGDYKIVNIANVPHLQDKEGFFIFPAFCPTACSVSWVKP
jgi:hypothetical protein